MSSFERMGKAAPSGGYICTLSEEDLASQRGCVHPLLPPSSFSRPYPQQPDQRLALDAPQCDLGPRQVLWQESRRRQGTHKYHSPLSPLILLYVFIFYDLSIRCYAVDCCSRRTCSLQAFRCPCVSSSPVPISSVSPTAGTRAPPPLTFSQSGHTSMLTSLSPAPASLLGGPVPRSSTKLRTHRTPSSASNW